MSARKRKSWNAIWCARDRLVAEPCRNCARERERAHERGRADEDPLPEREDAARERRPRPRVAGVQAAEDDDDERDAHAELRDRGPGGRARDPPVEAVDEEHLEDDVRDVSRDDDDERRPEIRDPAQVPLAAQRDERSGKADRRDAEVGHGLLRRLALAADERDELGCERGDERGHGHPEGEREPDRLRAEASRRLGLPRTTGTRHLRRRPVLEEVEDHERAAEDHGGDPERSQLHPPEMPDDRGVDEQVERLRSERAERGNREPKDLPVVRRPQRHAFSVVTPRWRRSSPRTRRRSSRPCAPASSAPRSPSAARRDRASRRARAPPDPPCRDSDRR